MFLVGPGFEDKERFLRETDFLVRLMPILRPVRTKLGGWDEFGEKISTQMMRHRMCKLDPNGSLWQSAKRLVHLAVTGSGGKNPAIPKRIRKSTVISAVILADLSLWLAGELGISISVTKRLVAVMLIGVAESKSDWNTLAE